MLENNIERIGGVNIVVSPLAIRTVRKFPASKNRSNRVRKKLIKRFGSEFATEPAAMHTPSGLVVHPSLYAELCARINGK